MDRQRRLRRARGEGEKQRLGNLARDRKRIVPDGEQYERTVVGTTDSMARQMIAAELLSALAGRNPERRERARTAFDEIMLLAISLGGTITAGTHFAKAGDLQSLATICLI